jgi:hypothetical protein
MRVEVECYSGHRGEQTPRRFALEGRSIEVAEILDQWQGPDYRYFKLRGGDENLYILRHDEAGARWELTLFESPRGAAVAERTPPGGKKRRGKPH